MFLNKHTTSVRVRLFVQELGVFGLRGEGRTGELSDNALHVIWPFSFCLADEQQQESVRRNLSPFESKGSALWRHYSSGNSSRDEESVCRGPSASADWETCDWTHWFVSLSQRAARAHMLSSASSSERSSSIMWSTCSSPSRWHMVSVMLCVSAAGEKPLAASVLMSVHQFIHQRLNTDAYSSKISNNKKIRICQKNATNIFVPLKLSVLWTFFLLFWLQQQVQFSHLWKIGRQHWISNHYLILVFVLDVAAAYW